MTIEETIERLDRARLRPTPAADPATGQVYETIYRAICPVCGGSELYLLHNQREGRIDFQCMSGADCAQEEICAALGIDPGELLPYERAQAESPLIASFKPMSAFEEREAEWLVEGWLPKGQIAALAADGGVGKTSLLCSLAAAVSTGGVCLLDPPGTVRKPGHVLLMNAEDSVREQLKRRLREAGANMDHITAPDFVKGDADALRRVKFGSRELETVIRVRRPELCIFDPIQAFLPPRLNMGSRNEMRDCLEPLISLGENWGTTFVIVCHSNKRKGAYGRDRIADSADIWDISRSVIMMGYTETEGVRYISNEKNSYAKLQETRLFTINSQGRIESQGGSWKRDREYVLARSEQGAERREAPKREDCKRFILETVRECGGRIGVKELGELADAYGYSVRTLGRAKQELKQEGKIFIVQSREGKGKANEWTVTCEEPFTDVTKWERLPFDELAPSER